MLKLIKKKVDKVPKIPQAPAPVEPAPAPMIEESKSIPEVPKEAPKEAPVEEEVVEDIQGPWSVQHVATQTQEVIYNSETKESLTMQQALVKILNVFELEE